MQLQPCGCPMRRFVSALALAALVSILPGSLMAQTGAAPVTPELSDRLRDAVAERQGLEPDGAAGDLAARLAASTQYDAETLDDLVAPVALYPDALLAQVLVAATFPDQIVSAGALIERGDDMTDAELSDALAAEEWDPSVLALLSGFPTVIARMADDMDWTTQLGAAMLHQDGDVLQAVQRMRTRAEGAGNLVSNEAQVVERTDETISIRPANPDVVYVPDYDPDVVYVSSRSPTPYVGPYTEPQPAPGIGGIGTNTLISGALGFGAGFLVNELLDDDDNGGGNKNKNKNDGWDDYWRRDQVIDWRDRRVYPRPYRDVTPVSWGQERDQYWDRGSGKWRRDEAARRRDAEERRRLLYWSDEDDRQRQSAREDREFRAWRERARQEARQEERRREQRAERRQELRKNQALEAREVREAREAREAREERRAQQARQERREAQREREAAREKADKAAVAKAKAASVEKTRAAERARAAEKAENREKAARAAAREKERAQAARETRAKAQEKARKAESERKPAQAQKAENPSQKELVRQLKAKQKAEKAEKARAAEKKAAGRDEPQRKSSQERQQKAASKKCAPDDERKSCRKG